MNKKFSVIIIGAGKIGSFFDTPQSKNILTHAHAFTKYKEGFNFVGFIDTNKQKAEKAASIWGGEAFPNIESAFNKKKIDIVVVAVPDKNHYEVLEKISRFPIRLVFAEKPLANTEKEAEKILKLYKQKNIPVVVNYSRRFVPEFKRIKRNVEMGSYGDFITGIGYYGKGLLHNGSHLIDLLRWFLGEIKKSTIIDSFIDFDKNDPSVSAVLNFKKKKNFFLQSVNCNVFTIFEIDLLFEKKRIVIKDSGLRIKEYAIRENNIFKGYKNLVRTKEIKTSIYNSTFHAVENIYAFLNKGKALDCNLEDGYKTMKTCLDILGKKNRQQ